MSIEIRGIREYSDSELRKYECDTEKPFIFLSYAHKNGDVVRTVYAELCRKGFNVWLDAVKLPHNNSSWNESARKAILNPNCYCLLFFRSEDAVESKPCLNELTTAVNRTIGKLPLVSVDIWKKQTSMGAYLAQLHGDISYDINTVNLCSEFADITNKEANAVRLREDCDNDVLAFAERIAGILETEYGNADKVVDDFKRKEEERSAHSFKYDWGENANLLYDYFFGAFDTMETTEDESVFIGYSPAFGIKKYATERGENYIVFVNDIGDDETLEGEYVDEQVTLAYMCDDGSKAEDFINQFEADDENMKYYNFGNGYLPYYMENKMENRFHLCAIKTDEEIIFCDDNNMFLKYFFSENEKESIKEVLNKMSRYKIACGTDGEYMHWNY